MNAPSVFHHVRMCVCHVVPIFFFALLWLISSRGPYIRNFARILAFTRRTLKRYMMLQRSWPRILASLYVEAPSVLVVLVAHGSACCLL
jgi:hypothetical protein